MSMNEISKDSLSSMAGENPTEFDNMVSSLVNKYIDIWWKLCRKPVIRSGEATDYFTKRRRQAYTNKFVDCFIKKIESYPSDQNKAAQWKTEINHLTEAFILKIGFMHPNELSFLLSGGILESTEIFVNWAREFDSQIIIEDIGQAMRNVWIMNITQILLGKPVQCTPSVFAYSMLYPYTDNYIDNADFDIDCKRSYNSRFKRRLSGEDIEPGNDLETKIFSLVELIEKEYARATFPGVFDSLIGIHEAQCKSILQHHKGATPYDSDILGISFEKGGTSVLADAFLAKGNLTLTEFDFFFAYGLMLQLCDDLQDIKEDYKNDHHTIFSLMFKKWPVDQITEALFNIVDYVAELIDELGVDNPSLFKNLIKKNCDMMIYFAIAKNKDIYSKQYWESMKGYIPYNASYIKQMRKKLFKKFKRLKPSYNGISTEKILLEALKNE